MYSLIRLTKFEVCMVILISKGMLLNVNTQCEMPEASMVHPSWLSELCFHDNEISTFLQRKQKKGFHDN